MRTLSGIDLSTLPVTHQELIPASYLDRMNHMNVSWYTHLFGVATLNLYENVGLTPAYMDANDTGVFALEGHIRYVSEVRVDRHVTIRSRAIARNEKRVHFMHFMSIDETATLAAHCEFVAAHMDMLTRRMTPFLEPVAGGFDELIAQHRELDWEPPVCGSMGP